nr:LpqB family beta-propeller domain-containing protein [Propionicimonas sp.]
MLRCTDSRTRWLAAALGVLLALGGCATVPTSGPVEHHTPQANGVNSGVQVDPLPPSDGASQLLVVEGFLHAMSVYQPDYEIAREYLTEAASNAWHPEAGVQIYADGYPPTEYNQTVALPAPLSGKLDATGRYQPVSGDSAPGYAPGKSNVHNFTLVKNDAGQWRINNPPEGLLVSRYVFTTNFVAVNLHFLDAGGDVLVPDPRFFAAGDQALDAAVAAQLAGPSEWLAPAVRKVDTKGVTVLGVDVDDAGVAGVALGGSADRLPEDQRRTLLAELVYTLSAFTQVGAIRVAADGQAWRDDTGQAMVRRDTFSELAPAGAVSRAFFLVKDHKLQRLHDTSDWDKFAVVNTPLARPEQVAVSRDLTGFAVIAQKGTRLQTAQAGSTKVHNLRTGTGLLRPSFSRTGELWSPAASGLSGLQVFRGEQRLPVTVESPEKSPNLVNQPVVAMSLSPDGVRVAMILRRGGNTVVGLARVQRGADGGVILGGWRSIDVAATAGTAGKALDLGWVTETKLLVLQSSDSGAGESETSSVVQVSEDGATATDIGPSETANLTQLAVAPGRAVALGANGGVYRLDGEFNWNLVIAAVDAVAYSG